MSFISALKNITLACALTGATAFAAPAEPFNSGNSVAYEPNYTPKEKVDYCTKYATLAQYAVNDNKGKKCGYAGPRWGDSYNHHFNWCMNEPNRVQPARETSLRRKAITQCHMCDKQRNSDQAFAREFADNDCKSVLPKSQRDLDGFTDSRFNACNRGLLTQPMIDNIKSAQKTALNSCKNVNANKGKLSSTILKLSAKKTFKPLASTGKRPQEPDRNIELTRAKIDPTAEDDSVVVIDTEEPSYEPEVEEDTADVIEVGPSPKPRTEKIVVGNRYVDVPAYSEEADIDTGRVIKAGAAAVVAGTAAVATGAVAAKVLDYADDYEGGGITKAATGAAGALKEKLKNRVASGGAITKTMSGAKEALKTKLKERAASGGLVSKAASGFKEKLKTRMTGGGGGLMKGMAKAGGGLMRGLFRR